MAGEAGETEWLLARTSEVMQVRSARWVEKTDLERLAGRGVPAGIRALEMRGRLLVAPRRAYLRMVEVFRDRGFVLLLRRDGSDHVAVALPGSLREDTGRPWVAGVFFLATLLSVLWLGAAYRLGEEPMASLPTNPMVALLYGWPYAASLLGILVAHEMGHFLVARRLGMPASLPYFIPLPFPPFGTMGAVIQAKAPPHNRRELLMVGVAGPLAGMVVALPVLIVGLMDSPMGVTPPGIGFLQEGNSLLYIFLKYFVFGLFLPWGNVDVHLNSVAWAGWVGILLTGINLMPVGMLDGGHIAYAALGRRARWLSWGVLAAVLGLSLLWQGWLLWAALMLLLGRVYSVPLDDVTELRPRESAIALLAMLLFLVTFIPIPLQIK